MGLKCNKGWIDGSQKPCVLCKHKACLTDFDFDQIQKLQQKMCKYFQCYCFAKMFLTESTLNILSY